MTSMDLTESIIPKSDQINADEIMAPVTYTIREVKAGSVEQPFDFLLVETDRAYRPSKTMRRVIVNAWGPDAANYAGRRLTLYREPSIMFGGQKVGGIRISHMSHINGKLEVMAQTTRGKREKFTVQPLDDPAPTSALPYEPVTTPIIAKGKLGAALKQLTPYQRQTLFTACGLATDGAGKLTQTMTADEIRPHLCAKWDELGLDDFGDNEPVPVTLLGAIYEARPKPNTQDVEEFQRFAATGEDTDPGGQTTIAGEVPA